MTAKGEFPHDYLDTKKRIAATHIQLRENENRVLCSALLYVKDRKITGIETLVQHVTSESRFQPTELGAPIRGMNDPFRQARNSLASR